MDEKVIGQNRLFVVFFLQHETAVNPAVMKQIEVQHIDGNHRTKLFVVLALFKLGGIAP